MCNRKPIFTFLLCLLTLALRAQDKKFTSKPGRIGDHALVAYINGGAGFFFSRRGAPDYLKPQLRRINPVGTVRLLWHPDHLLKVGLESGYIKFYEYGLTDSAGNSGRVSLEAVPLLLVWSMSLSKHFNIFAGSGAYFLRTNLDYMGKSSARKFSVGWMAAASYIWPIGKNAGLGTEFKWLYAAETSNGSLCLQVQYVWKFAKW
ncbi:hypothetical protein EPD60_15240 [Flaviaesturariibacter flavus]|uniref:Outer membrane protein beta-barrel domain-containing protein n=1 Tax=Flaviaesturariibacter flavus TaxID=2502780 RepID=A0A4R1B8T8_9BACT|nr:hypothetical protein [Flaviaesturariibacter flavus]TCJ12619.1 hypothetical protein EPD60_15240 [Flaviaesturariibacter flavus]